MYIWMKRSFITYSLASWLIGPWVILENSATDAPPQIWSTPFSMTLVIREPHPFIRAFVLGVIVIPFLNVLRCEVLIFLWVGWEDVNRVVCDVIECERWSFPWEWSRDDRTRCDLFSNLWKIRFILIHFVLRVCSFVDVCHEIFSDVLNVRSILENALVESHRFSWREYCIDSEIFLDEVFVLELFRFFVREFFLRIFGRFVVFRDLHWRIRCRSNISSFISFWYVSVPRRDQSSFSTRIVYFSWIACFDPAGSTNSSNPISPSQKIPGLFHAWMTTSISPISSLVYIVLTFLGVVNESVLLPCSMLFCDFPHFFSLLACPGISVHESNFGCGYFLDPKASTRWYSGLLDSC
jgi:hypothetical protein